jgi:hypothetical protein
MTQPSSVAREISTPASRSIMLPGGTAEDGRST